MKTMKKLVQTRALFDPVFELQRVLRWNNSPVDSIEIPGERIERGFQKMRTIGGKMERIKRSMAS